MGRFFIIIIILRFLHLKYLISVAFLTIFSFHFFSCLRFGFSVFGGRIAGFRFSYVAALLLVFFLVHLGDACKLMRCECLLDM